MLKFRCQHCRQRIAVPARNLGKLVTCSECGAQTHPLAEQIAAAGPAPRADASPARSPAPPAPRGPAGQEPHYAPPAGACGNCGVLIGRLQTASAWDGHTVCASCYRTLSGESGAGPTDAPLAAPAPGAARAVAVVTRAQRPGPVSQAMNSDFPRPLGLDIRERVLRALIVFVVASVALYGALSLLRDVAGLIAVAAVAVIALLSLYALFRGAIAARRRAARPAALATVPREGP